MGSLFNLTTDYDIPIQIVCNLFDSYVGSIFNYNYEVWGFNQAENIERVYRKFCKRLLNVKTNTNSLTILSELGRYPLIINKKIRIIKYWLKLHTQKSNNCILAAVIKQQKSEITKDRHIKTWCNKVKILLESTGFFDIWFYPESVEIEQFIPIFKVRVKDIYIYISHWRASLQLSPSKELFYNLKDSYEISSYIFIPENRKQRNIISKIRLSSYDLKIETGRHNNTPRNIRLCELCSLQDIEDEYHFTLISPFFQKYKITVHC